MDKHSNVLFPLLSSIIALILTGVYLLFRYPLEIDSVLVLKVLAVSLFLINAPYGLFLISKKNEFDFYSFNIWIVVIVLFLFIILGLLNFCLPFLFFVLLGATTFSITLFYFIKSISQHRLWHWNVFFIILLSVWLAGVVWDGKYLSPLFLEKIAFGFFNSSGGVDTFYHMSIAQMIKTYNVASTGLDEIPYIPYHFGSHFLFAQISKVAGISIIDIYNLGFPIIFLPLFFHVVFLVFHQFKEQSGDSLNFGYFFWVILFVLFIGVLPFDKDGIGFRTGYSWNSLIVSESYLISMIFFTMFLSVFIVPIINGGWGKMSIWRMFFFIFFVTIIGFSKVSTLFVLDFVLLYLFVKFKLYHFVLPTFFLFFVALISILIYYLFFDPYATSSGHIEYLSFFKHYIKSDFITHFIFTFFWTLVLIFIWLFLFIKKIQVNTILIELQIVIAIIGFIPGMLMKISGGSAYYFSDIQHWSALFFIPYYSTYFIKHFQGMKLKIINFFTLLCLLFAMKNCVFNGVRVLKENFVTKSAIMEKGHYTLDLIKLSKNMERKKSII